MFRFPTITDSIDYGHPVEDQEPLAYGLTSWWLTLPQTSGSLRWLDLCGRWPGTLTSMVQGSASGWQGSFGRPGGLGSLMFDAVDDWVQIVTGSALAGQSEFSLTACVYQRSGGGGGAGRIAAKGVLDPWDCYSSVVAGSGQPTFYTNGNFFGGSSTFLINTWTHLGFTFSVAANVKAIYTNGLLSSSTTAPGALNASSSDLALGNLTTRTDRGFDGFIDDIRLYSGYALSSDLMWQSYEDSFRGSPRLLRRATRTWFVGTTAAAAAPVGKSLSVNQSVQLASTF